MLNNFVVFNRIHSVIEFGSGDGAQLELAKYPSYIGVDISEKMIGRCCARFRGVPNYRFVHAPDYTPADNGELSLSLDVIYHLVEDDIYEAYMRQLFNAATRFVIVYASNKDAPGPKPHVRHRKFTDWVELNRPRFKMIDRIPNRYPEDASDPNNTSFADFYIFERQS